MRECLKNLRKNLRPIYGNGETEAIIRIIFHHLKGWSLTDMLIHEPDTLSPFIRSQADSILNRLMRHEPIQYITGEARFHGMEINVTPDVLIPRPETDELVDIIINEADEASDLRVLDIATGSGCIAIALARSLRFPEVTAIDISQPALNVAKENAKKLKANVRFIKADILSWTTSDRFDIIVSNPPYIGESEKSLMERNVLDYEPPSALFVPDDDPLIFYRHITRIAASSLSPTGRLYLEINPLHASALGDMLANRGFSDIDIIRDSYGRLRFLTTSYQSR